MLSDVIKKQQRVLQALTDIQLELTSKCLNVLERGPHS